MSENPRYAARRRRATERFRGPAGPSEQQAPGRDAGPDPHDVVRAIVLRQLTASAKSRHQLEDKLADRGVPEAVAAEVLDRFEELGLVDDREYAAMFVRSRAETRKLSRAALRRELTRRGIGGDLAEQALQQRTDEDEEADAHELVRRKLPASVDPSDRKEHERLTRRLVGMLGRRGYPAALAFGVVKAELERYAAPGDGPDPQPWPGP